MTEDESRHPLSGLTDDEVIEELYLGFNHTTFENLIKRMIHVLQILEKSTTQEIIQNIAKAEAQQQMLEFIEGMKDGITPDKQILMPGNYDKSKH